MRYILAANSDFTDSVTVVKAIVATIARNTGQLKRVDLPCGDGHATIGKA